MGAGFPVFAGAMFRNLGLNWGCSLLGFLSIAFIPIPVMLYVWGRKIRMTFRFFRNPFLKVANHALRLGIEVCPT